MSARSAWEMSCPCCGSSKELHITASRVVEVILTNSDSTACYEADTEWTGKSLASCELCKWEGTVDALEKAYAVSTAAVEKVYVQPRHFNTEDLDDFVARALSFWRADTLAELKDHLTIVVEEKSSDADAIRVVMAVRRTLRKQRKHVKQKQSR